VYRKVRAGKYRVYLAGRFLGDVRRHAEWGDWDAIGYSGRRFGAFPTRAAAAAQLRRVTLS
jgi:hypothetical protein